MVKKGLIYLVAVLFVFSMGAMVFAGETKGTISKVGDGGKTFSVKDKAGAETNFKGSKTTKFTGIGGREELKEGQKVTIEAGDDGVATAITIR